ncbi:hypothetical protein [Natronococcus occultus]|uniref:Cardiolipin synthase N-terminal domain-containing protein n=1 Tax=Natronococcus occultus SP4 TaxID=694430 RepID=L0JVF7_9EURY|nr:hypothetical protein [Natronococcus occultus]AGB36270.1 hypothetical protein Natoc_0405 [Natronococcus occultus SP4]
MLSVLNTAFVLQAEGEELPMDESTFVIIALAVSLVLLLITIGVGYWIYKDASKRENNELLWALGTVGLLFFFFPAGVIAAIAYVLVRGEETTGEAESQQAAPAGQEW